MGRFSLAPGRRQEGEEQEWLGREGQAPGVALADVRPAAAPGGPRGARAQQVPGRVRPLALHHREGAREGVRRVRRPREDAGGAGRPQREEPRLRLRLLREHQGRDGGQGGHERPGARRQEDQGGLQHHQAPPHAHARHVHGAATTTTVGRRGTMTTGTAHHRGTTTTVGRRPGTTMTVGRRRGTTRTGTVGRAGEGATMTTGATRAAGGGAPRGTRGEGKDTPPPATAPGGRGHPAPTTGSRGRGGSTGAGAGATRGPATRGERAEAEEGVQEQEQELREAPLLGG